MVINPEGIKHPDDSDIKDITIKSLMKLNKENNQRIADLLASNNELLQRAREAESALSKIFGMTVRELLYYSIDEHKALLEKTNVVGDGSV